MSAPNPVVIGVGTDGVDAALRFGVGEARRHQLPLHLIHVLQLPARDAYVGVHGIMLDTAKVILDEAKTEAEELAGDDVAVTAELIDSGWVVEDLVRHLSGVSLLVLQHRAKNKLRRVLTGSIAQTVAGRSPVPVVSVPEGWKPRVGGDPVVVAAVQDPVEARALLRAAFEESRARSARLVVLHAWRLASRFDVVVVDIAYRDVVAARGHEELKPILAPLRAEFPDVHVTVTVQHAPPIEAVLDATENSDLLVLGRRHHLLPSHSHLGPVARAALDHGACPVFVTPELGVTATAAPDSDLATAGT